MRLKASDNTERLITGKFVLNYRDVSLFQLARLPHGMMTLFISGIVVFTGVWLLVLPVQKRAYLSMDLVWAIRLWIMDVGIVLSAVLIFFSFGTFLIGWLNLYRVPVENRILTIEASSDGLKTQDSANASIQIPWKMVQKIHVTKALLMMRLSSRCWRYVPIRAFNVEDRVSLIELAMRKSSA